MNTITIVEAWELWVSGSVELDSHLWGVPLFWWGRIGKAVQLLAAFSIIAEIVGAARLREYGSSLRGVFSLGTAHDLFADTWKFLRATGRSIVTSGAEFDEANKEASKYKTNIIHGLVWAIMIVAFVVVSWGHLSWWGLILATIGAFWISAYLAIPVAVLIMAAFACLGLVMDALLFEPMAYILEHEKIDHFVRIISLLLLIAGSCLDMLTS